VGPTPTAQEVVLLKDYAARLKHRVQPAVQAEIESLAREVGADLGTTVIVSSRAKKSNDILDKVQRMTTGWTGMPARSGYRAGDVIDAVGARLTVSDMQTLEAVFDRIQTQFGVGDGGRILEIENMYAEPKSKAPEYRVIPMIISVEVDGRPYTFELQLTTERASVAADINHNTVYKPYVTVDRFARRAVMNTMREAAALDQLETIREEKND
jgi:ppGpp synthetase/RelA/SpoT-type nucleotidyltranferase